MTVVKRASQAIHSPNGLERPATFTAFPEFTLPSEISKEVNNAKAG